MIFFDENIMKIGIFYGEDIMTLIIETIFGFESKFCICGFEVRH